jgi:hypothetical protein
MRLDKKVPLIIAYYRGRWVWVPILHAPENSREDFLPYFKIEILKGKKKFPPSSKRCCQKLLTVWQQRPKRSFSLAHCLLRK